MKTAAVLAALFLIASAAVADHQVDNDFSSEWEATGFNNGRRMVRDSQGFFHVVYHSQVNPSSTPGGNCFVMYSHTLLPAPPSSSSDWAQATLISQDPGTDDRYPSIAIEHGSPGNPTDNDMLHVVWQSRDVSGVYQILHSSNINCTMPVPGTWTPPTAVHVSFEHSLVPDVDCSLNNIVHVVWQEENYNPNRTSEILYSKSADHGASWTGHQNLSLSEFNSQTPDVATVIDFEEAPSNYTYYSDRIHVVWSDDAPVSGPFIIYTSSPDAGNTWDVFENVSMFSGSEGNDGYPTLTVSREDIPHAAWMHGVLPHDPTDPGPYTPGVNPMDPNSFPGPEAGMYSTIFQTICYSGRNGGSWGAFETLYASGDSEFPSIAVDHADTLHLAWQSHSLSPQDYDIWYGKRYADGGSFTDLTQIANYAHDDLFPSEATKKTAMYTPGYDFVWTRIDSDLSAGGHGVPAALSPAHEIWFSGNTHWNLGVNVRETASAEVSSSFRLHNNPVSNGTWISTDMEGGAVSIVDISGRSIYSTVVPAGAEGVFWEAGERLPEGVYRVVLVNSQGIQSQAVTVIR